MPRVIGPTRLTEAVRLWREEGLGVRAVARRVGISPGTVRRAVAAACAPDGAETRLRQRRAAAATNARRWPHPRPTT